MIFDSLISIIFYAFLLILQPQRDIQMIPHDMLVKILQDIVTTYKKKLEDDDIDALIAEADEELSKEGESSKPLKQRRAEFIQTCNHIAAKYF